MLCCMTSFVWPVVVIVIVIMGSALARLRRRNSNILNGAHVLITGGSSGIGLHIAIEVARRGASVTLLARNKERLAEAKQLVEKEILDADRQKVITVSVDLSKDYNDVERGVDEAENINGKVDFLVNSAGFSVCGRFEDIPVEDFTKLLSVNYIGSIYATRAVIRGMKERRRGHIVFVSSQAGQMGLYGYTGYCASKFALRGLAEALQMEVKPYNIHVCVSFPPDTDTPGYVEEMKTKLEETRLISESSPVFQPHDVAVAIIDDALAGRFHSYVGIDGYMLATVTCGMSPFVSVAQTIQQVLAMGLFRAIGVFYLMKFDRIVERCRRHGDRQ